LHVRARKGRGAAVLLALSFVRPAATVAALLPHAWARGNAALWPAKLLPSSNHARPLALDHQKNKK
jgi:hypothetical protein